MRSKVFFTPAFPVSLKSRQGGRAQVCVIRVIATDPYEPHTTGAGIAAGASPSRTASVAVLGALRLHPSSLPPSLAPLGRLCPFRRTPCDSRPPQHKRQSFILPDVFVYLSTQGKRFSRFSCLPPFIAYVQKTLLFPSFIEVAFYWKSYCGSSHLKCLSIQYVILIIVIRNQRSGVVEQSMGGRTMRGQGDDVFSAKMECHSIFADFACGIMFFVVTLHVWRKNTRSVAYPHTFSECQKNSRCCLLTGPGRSAKPHFLKTHPTANEHM